MTTNQLYDVIVVGASEEGLALCEQLSNKTKNAKIALVSKHFNLQTPKHNLQMVDKFEQEVVFSYYKHRLLGVYFADRNAIFGKSIVIATGSKPIKSNLKNTNIQYNLNNIKYNKAAPVVVFGKDNTAATYAISLSKKFKYVYLCSDSLELECDNKYLKKIENIANIVCLPNCNIIACKNDKEGNLVEVQLDTYSSIRCNALVMSLGRMPEKVCIDKRMLKTDSDGFIIVKENNETTEIPNIFAIGTCTKNPTKAKITAVANTIIKRHSIELKEE
jgi:thioredoxin reductase